MPETTEEKKTVNGVSVDVADITKETLTGLSGIVPILEKHPRGTLALLVLLSLGAGTAIAISLINRHPSPPEKKELPQASESEAVKPLDGEEGGNKTWMIRN